MDRTEWAARLEHKERRWYMFDLLAWYYNPATAGKAMRGQSTARVEEILEGVCEADDLGDYLHEIDPDAIAFMAQPWVQEFLGHVGHWRVSRPPLGIFIGSLNSWIGAEPYEHRTLLFSEHAPWHQPWRHPATDVWMPGPTLDDGDGALTDDVAAGREIGSPCADSCCVCSANDVEGLGSI